jgi:hypothetical protein
MADLFEGNDPFRQVREGRVSTGRDNYVSLTLPLHEVKDHVLLKDLISLERVRTRVEKVDPND